MDGATFSNKLKLDSSPANCPPSIDEKLYEYVEQQNKLANGQYTNGDLCGSSSDEHISENDASDSEPCVDECDESPENEETERSDGSEDSKHSESDNNDNDDDEDSDSDDDDDLFADMLNQHFEGNAKTPIIVSFQTDSFPCFDDSEPIEKEVKFFIDKCRSTAMAECDGTEYRIGFLDLTPAERHRMDMFSQSDIYLNVKSNHIMIRDNRLHIKRITEREILPSTGLPYDSMYEQLKLGRVQFGTEPFFAKYQNEVYFVGERLNHEYSELLKHTKKSAGIAIRIGHDRLVIDDAMQTLDVHDSISFKSQKEICVIPGTFDMYKFQDEYPLTGFQRFMICKNPWLLLEIEPELLHSSIYDDCTEIYAEMDFPFEDSTKFEMVVKPAKAVKQKKKSEPRYLNEE